MCVAVVLNRPTANIVQALADYRRTPTRTLTLTRTRTRTLTQSLPPNPNPSTDPNQVHADSKPRRHIAFGGEARVRGGVPGLDVDSNGLLWLQP